ncbi:MAG: PAS domain S-box protein [Pseudomonadota bacterium]
MQGHEHSYLDLSVLPELRHCILSNEAVVLFNKDLRSLLWANAAGAKLFGGQGVEDLLNVTLSDNQSVIRQLRDAIAQVQDGEPIIRGVRINQGVRSILLQFEIRQIDLPGNDLGYMVTSQGDQIITNKSESSLANMAVESLDGFADAAAILDDYGLPLAASQSFGELGPEEDTLQSLVESLKSEDDRLIKRPETSLSGETVVVGIARLTDKPGRNLIVLARTEQLQNEENVQDVENSIADEAKEHEEASNIIDEDSSAEEHDTAHDVSFEDDNFDSEILAVIQNFEPAEKPEPIAVDEIEPEKSTLEELSQASDEVEISDDADVDEPITQDVHEEEQAEIAFESDEDEISDKESIDTTDQEEFDHIETDVRFAWTVDDLGIFQSVSQDLADVVGPQAAEVVGKNWADISAELQIDPDNEIGELLGSTDTWSGKTVLWPIQNTDMSVPVDLAGLPLFNSERVFQGIKGFGVIRTADVVVDPSARGLSMAQPEADDTDDINSEPETRIKLNEDEQDNTETLEGLNGENVVQLANHRPSPVEQDGLTDKEASAFNEIGETLRTQSSAEPEVDEPELEAEEVTEAAETEQSEDTTVSDEEDTPAEVEDSTPHIDTSIMDNLPVAIVIYRSGETLYANRRMLDAVGYESIDELAEAGGVDALFEREIDSSANATSDQTILTKSGNELNVNPILQTVPWKGEKALLLSFAPDSDLHIDEPLALEINSSSEVQNILDTTSDGILLLDPEGNILSANASAEALFGYSYDPETTDHITRLLSEESHDNVQQYIDSLSETGVGNLLNEGVEALAREANGGLFPIFLNITKMQSNQKLCAVVRDMTSWKKAEEEINQSRQAAVDANEQKSEFLAHVSHEIRTPLNAIIGFSDVMIEERFGPVENERYREYLRDINRSGNHVLELVNDLLDLSKIEAGKLELAFEAVDLNQIIAETVALLQPQANSNRIIIRTSLSRAVPKVVADIRSIRQIVLNLVSNAIKFSNPNSQVIVSTVYDHNGEVTLRIRDTGEGMTPSEVEEALKPFHQVHSVSERSGEGTGLGLPLTKALIEANRAVFDLESERGSGTIAHVRFPTQRVLAD